MDYNNMKKTPAILFVFIIFIEFCAPKRIDIRPLKQPELSLPNELFQKGRNQRLKFTAQGYKEAIEFFQKTLEIDCTFYKSYPELALTYALWAKEKKDLEMDNTDLWVKAYFYTEKAMELYPSPDVLKAKALLCIAKNFLTEIEYKEIFQWTQSPRRRSDKERVISYLKDLFGTKHIEKREKAIEYLRKILSENPNDEEALLFKWMIENPGFEKSEDVQKVFQLNPDLILPYYEIGNTCLRMGKFDEAEKWFHEVLKRNSVHPRALSDIGEIYLAKGKGDEALEYFKKAVCLDNELPYTHFNLGLINYDCGENEKSLNEFKKALELRPDWEEASYQLSLIFMEEKRWQEAIESLNHLIKIHGSFEISGYALRASCYLMIEDFSKAVEDCKEAIKINPQFDIPHFIYGIVYFNKGKLSQAKDKLIEALKLNNHNADAHYYLAKIYLRLQKYNLAKPFLRRALILYGAQKEEILKKIEEEKEKSRVKKVEKLKRNLEELISKIKYCEVSLENLENLK